MFIVIKYCMCYHKMRTSLHHVYERQAMDVPAIKAQMGHDNTVASSPHRRKTSQPE